MIVSLNASVLNIKPPEKMAQVSLLARLLNDESFIQWVEGHAAPENAGKWEAWLLEDSYHQEIVKKAQKLLNMPFKTYATEDDQLTELQRLKKNLHNREKS